MDRLFLLPGIKGGKSIKLSREDSKFRRSKEFPGSENLVLAAIALETIDDSKTKYGQATPYNQRSVIGVLMSVLGWDAGSENRANPKDYENWWDDHKKSQSMSKSSSK